MGWDGNELHNFFNGSEIEGGGKVGFPDYSKKYTITFSNLGMLTSSNDTAYFTISDVFGHDGQYNYRGFNITAKENIWIRGDFPLPKGQTYYHQIWSGKNSIYNTAPVYVYPCK